MYVSIIPVGYKTTQRSALNEQLLHTNRLVCTLLIPTFRALGQAHIWPYVGGAVTAVRKVLNYRQARWYTKATTVPNWRPAIDLGNLCWSITKTPSLPRINEEITLQVTRRWVSIPGICVGLWLGTNVNGNGHSRIKC